MARPKAPAFQFYAADFLVGVASMPLAERGAYITLLAIQWNIGAISGDDLPTIARVLGCSKSQAKAIWFSLKDKFQRGPDGLWRNERLEDERQKQAEYRRRQSDKGKASAAARGNGGSTKPPTKVQPLVNQTPNQNSTLLSSSSSSSSQEPIPASQERSLPGFEAWWGAYPKKVSKGAALKAWSKIKPDPKLQAQMLDALRWQVRQPGWAKDGGAFIPHPASYLNAQAYLDEPFFTPTESSSVPSVEETKRRQAEMESRGDPRFDGLTLQEKFALAKQLREAEA